ncbi:DISARM system phospholipase D-like protein DrmC [Streptomyces sp. NPDC004542]|uniref:DISARM system phospholipase D-like protein DrmC n=1 Tax=Streptomyces sp. NPDC004542 TaxID=3154281 RepID=UPI0033B49B8A
MRYTLRLLTAQQFQRAAALVSACEVLRREEFARDRRWGPTPFRIGLWVGASVSPNWFDEAKEQIAEAKESASDKHARVLQVLTCPWCGSGLTARSNMEYDEGRRRILLYCPRGEGEDRCPFSRREALGEGIPVLTVDEEIYRLAPSLLIATVDKFAQLPWNGYAGLLFGRVTELCPRHGYLRGYVAAGRRARDTVRVRTVWSGPSTPAAPVRATAQVLVEVIDEARHELLAMTYAARPYPALTRALTEAADRGVRTHMVVETLAGAGGLLSGKEPADAFVSVPGLHLWAWARGPAEQARSRQHAKLAVADRRTLFLGSANLTESAARRNIEAGVLVTGGEAPRRAAEHIVELQRLGVLRRIQP